jgi:RNA recognition motif-containing protein
MQEENNKLFVGNLSYNIGDAQLMEAFGAIEGVEVVEARVIMDRYSGNSRGFGFVTVANPEMAKAAIEAMNNTELDGRTIFVNISRPQTKDGDRGDRRSSGGGNRDFGQRSNRR